MFGEDRENENMSRKEEGYYNQSSSQGSVYDSGSDNTMEQNTARLNSAAAEQMHTDAGQNYYGQSSSNNQNNAYNQGYGYGENNFSNQNYDSSNGAYNQNYGYNQNNAYGAGYVPVNIYGQEPEKTESQGFGIASLVLGILAIVFSCTCINIILAILSVIFAIVQIVNSSKKGMAIAGIITSAVSIVFTAIIWFAIFTESADVLEDYDSYYNEFYDEFYDAYDEEPLKNL